MASIKQAIQKNQQRIAAGGETGTGLGPQPPQAPIVAAPSPQLDLPLGGGLPQRGTYPASLVLGGDINDSNRMFRGAGMRSTTFPNPGPTNVTKNTTIVQAAAASAAAASILSIQVSGAPTPIQSVLNLIPGSGISIIPDATGGVTFTNTSTGTGDGLIHGDAIWEIDPAFVLLRDDFIQTNQNGTIASFVSELPWYVSNNGGTGSVFVAGDNFPYSGFVQMSNSGTANRCSFMMPQIQSQPAQMGMPVLDYPGWKMIWNFKVGRTALGTPGAAFNWAQVSYYLGLANYPGLSALLTTGDSPRPPYFLGLRYDTDTTAPAISDTQFVFEYVMNSTATPNVRINTQGTTIATGIAAVEGTSYRFEMSSTAAGSVVMTLTDGTTLFTKTMTVTQFSSNVAPSINGAAAAGITVASYSSPLPWGAGSIFTISGGNKLDINGTWTMISGSIQALTAEWYHLTASSGTDTGAVTVVYPAFVPFVAFGNDTTATPPVNEKAIGIDFFAFVWNPGVGGGTGTPNATLPRYF